MMNRILRMIVVAVAIAISVPAIAQMSDDAVYSYVKSGLAAGKSHQDLAKELAARGVTREQAERLKKRYEAEQQGANSAARTANAQERSRRANDGVSTGELELVTSQVAVESYVDAAQDQAARKTPVFGRNVFNNRNLTFAPSENIATPANYTLGPGDEVIIDIWGTNQNTIRQTISPDGFINIPDVGVIGLNGMTVKEADSYLRRKLSQIYSVDGEDAASEIKLTLGSIRTIQVNVMGEVAVPGTYYLSSLSNVYHALYRAGGFSALGSLRNIELIRNGKKVEEIDIYDFIIKGKSPEDISLQEGDIILVPTYEMLVDISGNVKRPMIYEMKDGETVEDIIGYAGGFMGNAYTPNLNMVRQNGREYQVYTIDQNEYSSFALMDGDAISVGAMIDRFENKLEVKGAVYRPGIYQLGDKISTLKQLIKAADGIKGDAFTNRALIHREREDYTLEVIPVDLKAVLNGTAADITLKPNDVLYVPSIHDLQDVGTITVTGEVAKPGTFVFAENTTLEDIIMQAGGLLESASTARIDVSRRIKDSASTTETETIGEVFTFSFKDGYIVDGDRSFTLQPYDHVTIRRSPGYMAQTSVTVTGEVVFPGTYTLTQKEERLSDLVAKAGGVNSWAYVKGARLVRRMNADERARLNAAIDMIKGAKDSISVDMINSSDYYSVGIDLQAAIASPGSEADIVLREGDRLIVPEYTSTVKISGNVMYPNVVSYNDNMTVKDYVAQAGGYAFKSKKSKAYIVYMNGNVAKAKKWSKGVVEPGCEIVIPKKQIREGNLQNILSIATTATSLSSMMATLGNLIVNMK